jgi:SAM-dependent methyltransferase
MTEALYGDPELAQFYDWDCAWSESSDCFTGLCLGFRRVLDLGCGTGIFAVGLAAKGHVVTGVDPAGAMLDIARRRNGGDAVRWVEASALGLQLDETFDAVVMTGHAFQTLLTAADRGLLTQTVARHLAPGGRFFFDSRNPEAREWEEWTPELTRETRRHPEFGEVERWHDAEWDAETSVVTYGTYYRLAEGRVISARSRIAFPSQVEIAGLIAEAGLQVENWLGDLFGRPFEPGCREIIPVGGRGV